MQVDSTNSETTLCPTEDIFTKLPCVQVIETNPDQAFISCQISTGSRKGITKRN